jgi:hypothetical protein
LIHVSSPLTIPSCVSVKATIRSKYSHCIVSLLSIVLCAQQTHVSVTLGLL